jgi:hypothetical protein
MGKEAYLYGKRGLLTYACLSYTKEAYLYGKRGLFVWEKRPIYMGKEAY